MIADKMMYYFVIFINVNEVSEMTSVYHGGCRMDFPPKLKKRLNNLNYTPVNIS